VSAPPALGFSWYTVWGLGSTAVISYFLVHSSLQTLISICFSVAIDFKQVGQISARAVCRTKSFRRASWRLPRANQYTKTSDLALLTAVRLSALSQITSHGRGNTTITPPVSCFYSYRKRFKLWLNRSHLYLLIHFFADINRF